MMRTRRARSQRPAETPESILLARDEQEKIRAALEALPVHYREIILLCDLEEMSYQEISQALSIPDGNGDVAPFAARAEPCAPC